MIPLSVFVHELNKLATRPITRQRVLNAVIANAVPGELRDGKWWCNPADAPAAAEKLSSRYYPNKANGPRARKARRLARGAA